MDGLKPVRAITSLECTKIRLKCKILGTYSIRNLACRDQGQRIMIFTVEDLGSFEWIHPDPPHQTYSLQILHDPERCMYPHTLVKLLREGQVVERLKSQARRLQLKEAVAQLGVLHEPPTSH
jgi:hypothetical protein